MCLFSSNSSVYVKVSEVLIDGPATYGSRVGWLGSTYLSLPLEDGFLPFLFGGGGLGGFGGLGEVIGPYGNGDSLVASLSGTAVSPPVLLFCSWKWKYNF